MSDRSRTRDVVAVESRISAIVDDTLAYRGIPIESLFEHATFEETAFLLWFDQLPSQSDLTAFRGRLASTPALGDGALALVRQAMPGGITRVLEAGVLGIGLQTIHNDPLTLHLLLLAGLPEIVVSFGQSHKGTTCSPIAGGSSISSRFLSAWFGREPLPEDERRFDRSLILTADHELNAATFAARVAASTRADLVSCVLAAIATQSGPLHGGAMVAAGELLRASMSGDPVNEIERRLSAHERIPGFGHSVYRRGDPRAALFRQLVAETADRDCDPRWLEIADQVARIGSERVGLAPNLDLYAAAYWSAIGIPSHLFPAVFAMGRVAGWIAHIREQNEDNRLIRPRARYAGRLAEQYIPIEQRGAWFTRHGS